MREAAEESGIAELRLFKQEIFDLDVHEIPARASVPAHLHYDLRFLIEADPRSPLFVSSESKDLQWIALDAVTTLNREESIARMVRKSRPLRG